MASVTLTIIELIGWFLFGAAVVLLQERRIRQLRLETSRKFLEELESRCKVEGMILKSIDTIHKRLDDLSKFGAH